MSRTGDREHVKNTNNKDKLTATYLYSTLYTKCGGKEIAFPIYTGDTIKICNIR